MPSVLMDAQRHEPNPNQTVSKPEYAERDLVLSHFLPRRGKGYTESRNTIYQDIIQFVEGVSNVLLLKSVL